MTMKEMVREETGNDALIFPNKRICKYGVEFVNKQVDVDVPW